MSSISHGLVLATAMVVSSTVLYLSCRQRSFPPSHLSRNQNSQQPQKPILRSCLHSGNCRNKIPTIRGMQENRIALYNGILKDRVRVQRMQCSC
ncbi:hypothetical protein CFP56_033991 [Quercus suber]|uniref:Uncharacterized protein n=1 Tax=Quercus suber TaxID=58331 RepID=A0AAW0JF28_QUESU